LVIRFLLLVWTKTCDAVCTLRHVDKLARFRGPLGTVYAAHRLSKNVGTLELACDGVLGSLQGAAKASRSARGPTDDQNESFDEVGVEGKPTTRTAVGTVVTHVLVVVGED
jgi:hypothetical protein